MKKISIMFVAALSLTAFAGCKKKGGGGDCAGAISGAMDRAMEDGMKEMKDMPADQKKMAEDMAKQMMPKMKDAMTKSCNDDKWSGDAIKCINDGKSQADMQMCEGKLTPEQKTNMEKSMSAAMGMGDMDHKMGDHHDMGSAAGSDMGSAAMAGSGSAAMAGSGSAMAGSAAPAMAGGDLPQDCADYKTMMDKLASCDKMPQASKDALKQGYDAMSASWANVGSMPADAKAAMASGCKAGADALKQTGAAVCGW